MSSIEFLTYDSLFEKGINKRENNKIVFNEIGMKNIVATISTMKLNLYKASNLENDKLNFKRFSSGKLTSFNYSRQYLFLLFKVFNDYEKERFNTLLNGEYDEVSFLHDSRLDEFTSEIIVDQLNTYRFIEYGGFCLQFMEEEIFNSINVKAVNSFFERYKNETKSSLPEFIDDSMKSILNERYNNLENELHLVIVLLIMNKYYKVKPTLEHALLFSLEFRMHNVSYSKNIFQLKKIIDKIINQSPKQKIRIRRR